MRQIVLLSLLAACASGPRAGNDVEPLPASDSVAGDSIDVPAMIPDPVAVQPPDIRVPPPLPDSTITRFRLDSADAALARADTAQALELLHRVIERAPGNARGRLLRGTLLFEAKRWREAAVTWQPLRGQALRSIADRLSVARMRSDRTEFEEGHPAQPWIEEEPREGPTLVLAAVGDIQMGQGWRPGAPPRLPPDDGVRIFAEVAPHLAAVDVAFGNLETALADSGASRKCRPGSRNCYAFRAPQRFARTLANAGFDVLSVNNNHAGDFGPAGRHSTVTALETNGIRAAGSTTGTATLDHHDLTVATLAFSTGDGPYRVQDIEAAADSIRELAAAHDLMIVSFHGGAEGAAATRVPRATERAFGEDRGDVFAFARAAVDAGADLVLGHGPHVLRAVEVYRGRLIAYSLGNFAAWHGFNLSGPLGISAILQVVLAPNGAVTGAQVHPVRLIPPGIPVPDPDRTAIATINLLSEQDFGRSIFDEGGHFRDPNPGHGVPVRQY